MRWSLGPRNQSKLAGISCTLGALGMQGVLRPRVLVAQVRIPEWREAPPISGGGGENFTPPYNFSRGGHAPPRIKSRVDLCPTLLFVSFFYL